jgi:hypothetical protein
MMSEQKRSKSKAEAKAKQGKSKADRGVLFIIIYMIIKK